MLKAIKEFLFFGDYDEPYEQIDNMKFDVDKVITTLTSLECKLSYLYYYGNSLSKEEKKFYYEDIKMKLESSIEKLNKIKNV